MSKNILEPHVKCIFVEELIKDFNIYKDTVGT